MADRFSFDTVLLCVLLTALVVVLAIVYGVRCTPGGRG